MSVLPDAGCVEVLALMHPPFWRKMKTLEAKYRRKKMLVNGGITDDKHKSVIVKITYMVN